MSQPLARPGYGDVALVRNPSSGREWQGPVLYWSSTGNPLLKDVETGETRWFPPDWTVSIDAGDGPPPCSCPTGDDMPPSKTCSQHGSADEIRKLAKQG